MAWITTSTDTGFFTGTTANLSGSAAATNAAVLWRWKSLLKTAGWTVPLSWRPGSASLGDVHTSSIDGWAVIKHPSRHASFFVSCSVGGTTVRMKYAMGGYQTSSLVNNPIGVRPNASIDRSTFGNWSGGVARNKNELLVNSTTTNEATLNAIFFEESSPFAELASCYVHIVAENTEPYSFHALCYPTSSVHTTGSNYRRVQGCFCFDAMQSGSYDPRDPDPFAIYRAATSTVANLDAFDAGTAQDTTTFYSAPNVSLNGLVDTPEFGNHYNLIDLTSWSSAITTELNLLTPGTWETANRGVNRSFYDGKVELFRILYHRPADMPDALQQATADPAYYGVKGASHSIFGAGTLGGVERSMANGSTISVASSGARDYIAIGSYVIPWSGVEVSGAHISHYDGVIRNNNIFVTGSGNWFSGSYLISLPRQTFMSGTITTIVTSSTVYRGFSGSNYVYSVGTPPSGATGVVVVFAGG